MNFEADYLALVHKVFTQGDFRRSRVGYTHQLFGTSLLIPDIANGFPILTTRQVFYKGVLGELAAFLRGATDLTMFKDFGCNYWDDNAAAWSVNTGLRPKDYSVGRIYGAQWRKWRDCGEGRSELDQISALVRGIKADLYGRRHLLTTYNPAEAHLGCLPPCHLLAQFNVRKGYLDCMVTMRSVDLCLGLPADIILYATLLILVARATSLTPGNLLFSMGDTHIYENHVKSFMGLQMQAEPRKLPTWSLDLSSTLDNFEPKHLTLYTYIYGSRIDYALNT